MAYGLYQRIRLKREITAKDAYLLPNYPDLAAMREAYTSAPYRVRDAAGRVAPEGPLPTENKRNLLFIQQTDGSFAERGEEMGVDIAGWTWNARFADLDGDGFQDLFAVNGWYAEPYDTENVWFRNKGGTRFVNASAEAGLNDMRVTMAALQFDADNDGDLDVLTFSPDGRLRFYRSVGTQNNHLQIDLVGPDTPIGTVIVIETPDGERQMREVRLSGGYQSRDPALTHFGLGTHDRVTSIELRTPFGEVRRFDGGFPAGRRYRITQETRR